MGLNLHKLGLRKNKRKENQTRSKGTFKVWMGVLRWSRALHSYNWNANYYQLCKLTCFQLIFNFNECNSKFEFFANTLPPLLYVISSIHPYYMPYYSFIHPYYMLHNPFI
jgi:hypothetical protein